MPGEAARSGATPVVLGMAGRPRSAGALKMAPVLTGTYVFTTGMLCVLFFSEEKPAMCFSLRKVKSIKSSESICVRARSGRGKV